MQLPARSVDALLDDLQTADCNPAVQYDLYESVQLAFLVTVQCGDMGGAADVRGGGGGSASQPGPSLGWAWRHRQFVGPWNG